MKKFRFAIFAVAAGLIFVPAAAKAEELLARTTHTMRIAGKKIDYVAEASRVPIRNVETGEPHGYMYYTAYKIPNGKSRPVLFIWNGGPGSPATLLHFEAFGPKRVEENRLVDNQETLLPVADLVFVDPIGTGFSRPAKPEYAAEFYGTLGDIASVTEFVRAWRLLNDAFDRPVWLMGESWGSGRAGRVAYRLGKLGVPVDGAVLISGGSGLSSDMSPALGQALRIVSYLPSAYYHNQLGGAFDNLDAALDAARKWAHETYAPALENLASLSGAQREEIAQALAKFTGLDATLIDRKTLRITPRQFRENIYPEDGKTLNTFDMRIVGESEEPDPMVLESWLRRDLGYVSDLPYIDLGAGLEQGYAPSGETPPSVGARWDYFTAKMTDEEKRAAIEEAIRVGGGPPRGGPTPPGAEEAVVENPSMRILVASGRYDSLASCEATAEMATTLASPFKEVYDFKCYAGGHMMYRDAETRVAFSRDVMALILNAGE